MLSASKASVMYSIMYLPSLFALLVSHGAGRLAGGLAGGLAFAASAGGSGLFEV